MTPSGQVRFRVALGAAALLAVGLGLALYRLVRSEASLDTARRSHAALCDVLRERAFLDLRTAAAYDRAGHSARAGERMGGAAALVDYVGSCTSAKDGAQEMGAKLGTLAENLHRAGRADELEALVAAMAAKRPGEWRAIDLPTDPARGETVHLIGWETDESVATARARAEGKGVMLFVTATWCVPCQSLERAFGKAGPYAAMQVAFVPLRLDVTEANEASTTARKRYGLEGDLPTVRFYGVDADRLAPFATISEDTPNYLDEARLEKALTSAAAQRPPKNGK